MPPPGERDNPKMVKLIEGARLATGDVFCVLDDDTVLPDGGLEQCLPYVDDPGVGLAFGLPYYVNFSNLWSSLVSYFVDSHSLLTYMPLHRPYRAVHHQRHVLRDQARHARGGGRLRWPAERAGRRLRGGQALSRAWIPPRPDPSSARHQHSRHRPAPLSEPDPALVHLPPRVANAPPGMARPHSYSTASASPRPFSRSCSSFLCSGNLRRAKQLTLSSISHSATASSPASTAPTCATPLPGAAPGWFR